MLALIRCLLWVLTTVTHEGEPIWRDSSNYKLFQVKVLPCLSMGRLFQLLNGLLLCLMLHEIYQQILFFTDRNFTLNHLDITNPDILTR